MAPGASATISGEPSRAVEGEREAASCPSSGGPSRAVEGEKQDLSSPFSGEKDVLASPCHPNCYNVWIRCMPFTINNGGVIAKC